METVKTAISIQQTLFEQAEELARTLKISRSRLFVIALEEYMRRRENQDLLAQINAAFADEPDPAEQTLLRQSQRTQRRLVEGEW